MSCIIAHLRARELTFAFNTKLYRQFYTTSKLRRNYYDSLGLTPKASQRDIKQAYYKLSLKYHPDTSERGESEKFREITAAYEVLGNSKLRRLYDRGALQEGHAPPPPPPEPVRDTVNIKTANARAQGNVGRNDQLNFDDWSKAHIERIFQREELVRQKLARVKARQEGVDQVQSFSYVFVVAGFLLLLGIGISLMLASSTQYDNPKKNDSKGKDR